MSIRNLLSENNYRLKIADLTVVDLDTSTLNTDTFTVNGIKPKGTILASDGTKMANEAPGADGYVLKSRPAQPNGVAWEAPAAGDGNIYDNDGTLTDDRVVDQDGYELTFFGGTTIFDGDFDIKSSLWTQTPGASAASNQIRLLGGEIFQESYLTSGSDTDYIETNKGAPVRSVRHSTAAGGISKYSIFAQGTGGIIDLNAPKIRVRDTAPTGSILTGDGDSFNILPVGGLGQVLKVGVGNQLEWATDAGLNIFNSDGTLSAARDVDCNGLSLNFTDATTVGHSADQLVLRNKTGTAFKSDEITDGGSGIWTATEKLGTTPVKTIRRNGAGFIDQIATTVGAGGGTYGVSTGVGGAINFIANSGTVTTTGTAVNLNAPTLLKQGVATAGSLMKGTGFSIDLFPRGTAGQVLKVNGAGTDLEWATDAAGVNIYNSDGTLTGARTVDCNNLPLTFDNASEVNIVTSDFEIGDNSLSTVTRNTTTTLHNDTVLLQDLIGNGNMQYSLDGVQYWSVTNSGGSIISTMLHNNSNFEATNQIVVQKSGGGTLTMFSSGDVSLTSPATVTINGTTATDITGSFIRDGTAPAGSLLKGSGTSYSGFGMGTANQYLRVNGAGTDLEWDNGENIYNSDGTLTGARTIDGAGNDLNLEDADFNLTTSDKRLTIQGASDVMSMGYSSAFSAFTIDRSLGSSQVLKLLPSSPSFCTVNIGENCNIARISGGNNGAKPLTILTDLFTVSPISGTCDSTFQNFTGTNKLNVAVTDSATVGVASLNHDGKTILSSTKVASSPTNLVIGDPTYNVDIKGTSGGFQVNGAAATDTALIGDGTTYKPKGTFKLDANSTAIGTSVAAGNFSVAIGSNLDADVAETQNVIIGDASDSLGFQQTVSIGYGLQTGAGTGVTNDGDVQFNSNGTIAPTGAKMRFWGQTVCDSAWRTGGLTPAVIDNSGSIARGLAASYAEMNVNANTNLTTISAASTYVKANMTGTVAGDKTSDWTITTTGIGNRMTYTGTTTRLFKFVSTVSGNMDGGGKFVVCRYRKNNTTSIIKSESYGFWDNVGKQGNMNPVAIISMATNDFIELFVANTSDSTDMQVSDVNIVATAL